MSRCIRLGGGWLGPSLVGLRLMESGITQPSQCGSGGLVDTNCRQSCTKLRECGATPESEGCAKPFECPVVLDERPGCVERALRGECRARTSWTASKMITSDRRRDFRTT